MSQTETQDSMKPAGYNERRRNPRVEVDFSVRIEGRTQEGEPFELTAAVDQLSCAGATLISDDLQLVEGARVTIEPPFGDVVEAEVNGVWTARGDGLRRVGVRLLDDVTWFNK